jgi:hypothetical protein
MKLCSDLILQGEAEVGVTCSSRTKQGLIAGRILATSPTRHWLIEYPTRNNGSILRLASLRPGREAAVDLLPCSYWNVPDYFINDMVERGTQWIGRPVSGNRLVPGPDWFKQRRLSFFGETAGELQQQVLHDIRRDKYVPSDDLLKRLPVAFRPS